VTDIADLAARAMQHADDATKPPSFERLRQALNEVGITKARQALREAPDLIAHARDVFRQTQEREKEAKGVYEQVVTEAEFLLGGCFEVRSNKTWLTVDGQGDLLPEAEQRSFTADEKKAWIADKAARQPDVRAAQVAYSGAERDRARAADDLAVAEMRLTVARHDVDAAAAELRFLSLVIREEN
jgi:hypothetical protein